MKLIVDADTDTVIGIHMIGPDCAEIMQVNLHFLSAQEQDPWVYKDRCCHTKICNPSR